MNTRQRIYILTDFLEVASEWLQLCRDYISVLSRKRSGLCLLHLQTSLIFYILSHVTMFFCCCFLIFIKHILSCWWTDAFDVLLFTKNKSLLITLEGHLILRYRICGTLPVVVTFFLEGQWSVFCAGQTFSSNFKLLNIVHLLPSSCLVLWMRERLGVLCATEMHKFKLITWQWRDVSMEMFCRNCTNMWNN